MFGPSNFLSIERSGYAIISTIEPLVQMRDETFVITTDYKILTKKVQLIMELRPLGIATEIVQEIGLDITYTYDDLVFIEHNPFILQFDDENSKNLNLFFNIDCEQETARKLEVQLNTAASQRGFTITSRGKVEMKQKENTEEVDIKFIE